MKKKNNRRSRAKYPALDPLLNLKTRIDLIDYDYVNKLDEKNKAWLNDFTEEYTNANLKHKGKKFHRNKSLKKDCYDRNNARNRDILTKLKAAGQIEYLEELTKLTYNDKSNNDTIIEDIILYIDELKMNKKEIYKRLKKYLQENSLPPNEVLTEVLNYLQDTDGKTG